VWALARLKQLLALSVCPAQFPEGILGGRGIGRIIVKRFFHR
jgi:hypothetical protein